MPLKKDQIIIKVTPRFKQNLERIAKKNDVTLSEYIRTNLEKVLHQENDNSLNIKDILIDYFTINEKLLLLSLEDENNAKLKSELENARDTKSIIIRYYINTNELQR